MPLMSGVSSYICIYYRLKVGNVYVQDFTPVTNSVISFSQQCIFTPETNGLISSSR